MFPKIELEILKYLSSPERSDRRRRVDSFSETLNALTPSLVNVAMDPEETRPLENTICMRSDGVGNVAVTITRQIVDTEGIQEMTIKAEYGSRTALLVY
jgi:hypothetical protein